MCHQVMTPQHFNSRPAISHLLVPTCHNPQYEPSSSPNNTMTKLSCKIQRFSFSLTLPRMCWRKLREGKKKKFFKRINNLDVPSDWKNTLISQLKHTDPNMKTPCAAVPLFENIYTNQMKYIRMISPVRRRRSENHYTSTPISLSIKPMTRMARMLPTYQQEDRVISHQEMESPGFKIYDVMDEKYKDIWGS